MLSSIGRRSIRGFRCATPAAGRFLVPLNRGLPETRFRGDEPASCGVGTHKTPVPGPPGGRDFSARSQDERDQGDRDAGPARAEGTARLAGRNRGVDRADDGPAREDRDRRGRAASDAAVVIDLISIADAPSESETPRPVADPPVVEAPLPLPLPAGTQHGPGDSSGSEGRRYSLGRLRSSFLAALLREETVSRMGPGLFLILVLILIVFLLLLLSSLTLCTRHMKMHRQARAG